jgi:hypothetical protein
MLGCVTRALNYPTSDSIINKQFGADGRTSQGVGSYFKQISIQLNDAALRILLNNSTLVKHL